MTTKSQVRKNLREYLKRVDPKTKLITYPMKNFRHAVLKTVELCKGIQKVLWSCNAEKEITTCRFLFSKIMIICSYDYKTEKIIVSQESKDDIEISPDELPALIKSRQPKVVISIKKKVC